MRVSNRGRTKAARLAGQSDSPRRFSRARAAGRSMTMTTDLEIKFYFAYTSPFTYLAWAPARELERTHRVKLRFIPYGVNIRKTYGNLDDATVERRKVRYLYLDARRIAKERGLIIYPPRKIFSCRLAFYGGQFAT